MGSSRIIIAVTIISTLSQIVYGERRCYDCVSPMNGTCGDQFDQFKDKFSVACETNQPSCLRMVFHSPLGTTIKRSCAEPDHCLTVSDSFEECNTCDWDYCNSSLNVSPSLASAFIGVMMAFMKYYLSF